MLKVTQNQYYGKESEVPSILPPGSSMFTDTGKMYFYPEGRKIESSSSEGGNSSGAKKLIMGMTQVGTGAPSVTLLENTSSLDFDNVVITRFAEGQYKLIFPSTDETLFGKLFPNIGAPERDAGPSSIELENLVGKGGTIEAFIVTKDSLGLSNDNLLVSTVVTIYESE